MQTYLKIRFVRFTKLLVTSQQSVVSHVDAFVNETVACGLWLYSWRILKLHKSSSLGFEYLKRTGKCICLNRIQCCMQYAVFSAHGSWITSFRKNNKWMLEHFFEFYEIFQMFVQRTQYTLYTSKTEWGK